jgi:hypothetical protein
MLRLIRTLRPFDSTDSSPTYARLGHHVQRRNRPLKKHGLSEKEIVARIQNGVTDAQADAEAAAREKARAHSGTGFVRVHGRRR